MTGHDSDSKDRAIERVAASLYFFPEERVTEARLREILESGSRQERCWAISHLLRYAQWDDIWLYVTREQVRDLFPEIDLPEKLRAAWARMLKIETPVGSS
jgi:hypothetical protein